ncbi:MAG: hypothetical protein GY936_08295 [Ignavibacteriae bacterium]|nr:hypothetical protein [Ignavibacteriota bacterium]
MNEINNSHQLVEKKASLETLGSTIITSLRVGAFGFAIVLSLIIVMKLLAFSTGAKEFFVLNTNDIVISSWGFIILSFSRFISFHKK